MRQRRPLRGQVRLRSRPLRAGEVRIETGRGVLNLELEIAGEKVRRVRVDMGEPILDPARIPVELPQPLAAGRIVDLPADEYLPWRRRQVGWRIGAGTCG